MKKLVLDEMNKLLFVALLLSANAMAQNVIPKDKNIECPSAAGHALGYQYAAKSVNGQKSSFQPISVFGDQKNTWVRFPIGAQWAVPYVPTEGADLYLTWDDDGACMKIAVGGGQSFYLGYQGEVVRIQWKGKK